MAVISGKSGKVLIGATTLAHITNWSLATVSRNPAYASSATGGYKKRVAGVKEASGTIAFKLDLADPLTDDFTEGAEVTLLLYLDAAKFYSVPAVIVDRKHLISGGQPSAVFEQALRQIAAEGASAGR